MIYPIEPYYANSTQLEEYQYPTTFEYKINEFERFYEQKSCADNSIDDKSNEDKSTELESIQPKNELSYVSEAEDATDPKASPDYQAEQTE